MFLCLTAARAGMSLDEYDRRRSTFATMTEKLRELQALNSDSPTVSKEVIAELINVVEATYCRDGGQSGARGPGRPKVKTDLKDGERPQYYDLLKSSYFKLPLRQFNFQSSSIQTPQQAKASAAWNEMLATGLERGYFFDDVHAVTWARLGDTSKAWGMKYVAEHADLRMHPHEYERKMVR